MRLWITTLLAGSAACLVGCANQVTPGTIELTISSQPPGAYLTEKNSGKSAVAPVTAVYKIDDVNKDKNGCYIVSGFSARWGSGAAAASNSIRMCPPQKVFNFVLRRNPADPGLDKDLAFANRLERQEREDSNAVGNAFLEGMAGAAGARSSGPQEIQIAPTKCVTKQVWGRIETECR